MDLEMITVIENQNAVQGQLAFELCHETRPRSTLKVIGTVGQKSYSTTQIHGYSLFKRTYKTKNASYYFLFLFAGDYVLTSSQDQVRPDLSW